LTSSKKPYVKPGEKFLIFKRESKEREKSSLRKKRSKRPLQKRLSSLLKAE
jgi:hypothetical protein